MPDALLWLGVVTAVAAVVVALVLRARGHTLPRWVEGVAVLVVGLCLGALRLLGIGRRQARGRARRDDFKRDVAAHHTRAEQRSEDARRENDAQADAMDAATDRPADELGARVDRLPDTL